MLTKLSALLLVGLVAAPSIASAADRTGPQRTPAAAANRAVARDAAGPKRERAAAKKSRMDSLCAKLECTSAQRDAIRAIRSETRERLVAVRHDVRELFHGMKADRKDELTSAEADRMKAELDRSHREHDRIVAGAISRIGAVLDADQRAELKRLVAKHGTKAVFGGFGHHDGKGKGKGKKAMKAKRARGKANASSGAHAKRARTGRTAKLPKRDRA